MLDLQACERRVYRLATLLTGNPLAATRVISQVVHAQPDLRQLDGPHMDRLTVLRSREIPTATIVDEHIPIELAEALAGLTPQQREAWVLCEVYHTPIREAAKAMDCSVTASQRHLEHAQSAIGQRLLAASREAAAPLLAYSMQLDVPRFYRAAHQRRLRTRQILKIVFAALTVLAGLLLVRWLLQHDFAPHPPLKPPASNGMVSGNEPAADSPAPADPPQFDRGD